MSEFLPDLMAIRPARVATTPVALRDCRFETLNSIGRKRH
jgi:hypothetical protein